MKGDNIQTGIYESLITLQLKDKLSKLDSNKYYIADQKVLDPMEASHFLSRHLSRAIQTAFSLITEKDKSTSVTRQIEISNKILQYLTAQIETYSVEEDLIAAEGNILQGVIERLSIDYKDADLYLKEITPISRLTQSELFTGGNVGLSLDAELKKEIRSADKIDLLVSFIKWKAIVILRDALKDFVNRGGRLRVITTTYMGATDAKALEELINLPNTEVKVSYNTTNERLHAKAYLFYRNTGFDTAYIGSSNFSRSALTDGLEWNVKVTTREIPQIIDKFKKTFESYWNNTEFESLKVDEIPKLRTALRQNKIGSQADKIVSFFDIKPYHYQKEILEKLHVARSVHHSYNNLVVAATGTGKTVIAAFDFKAYLKANPLAKFLFIAHRIEILYEAQYKFRNVLRDGNFGDIYGEGKFPDNKAQVFATIQTLSNGDLSTFVAPDYYDYIVLDEVHHSSASSYQKILDYFRPKILLGLTATPERMDGVNILADFDHRIAAEIRLPDALSKGLLCPFQYFGITDQVDYRNIKWQAGRYDKVELTNVYTNDDHRVLSIIDNLNKYCKEIHHVKALGFCVNVEHARFMQEKFEKVGLKAAYLTSKGSSNSKIVTTGSNELRSGRAEIIADFRKGVINYLFVVDIFNEGIDIPEIDTILFLRPTESLTIFLQQLGRGLRLQEAKEVLTVLDFVGHAREQYDYENKFRALIGRTQSSVFKEVEQDFPHLPLGCSIVLERKAKEYILENIRKATQLRKSELVNRIRNYDTVTNLPFSLNNFLKVYNLSLKQVYKNYIFSELTAAASGTHLEQNHLSNIRTLLKSKWISTESLHYFTFILNLLEQGFDIEKLPQTSENNIMALMLYYDFYSEPPKTDLKEQLKNIAVNKTLVAEMKSYLQVKISQIDFEEYPSTGLGFCFPLSIHARYTREQVLVALQLSNLERKSSNREGVAENKELNTEVLFINLKKSEEDFSPTTMYEDYAISELKFHWQSQNQTSPISAKGKSYINQQQKGKNILLFVREASKDSSGNTQGYVYLGPAQFESYYGSKPMSITWKLEKAIPEYLWTASAKLQTG